MHNSTPTKEQAATEHVSEFYQPSEGHVVIEPIDWNEGATIKTPDGSAGLPIGRVVAVGPGMVNKALAAAIFTYMATSNADSTFAAEVHNARDNPPCREGQYVLYDSYVTKSTVDDQGRKRLFMPHGNVMAIVTRPENIGKLPLGGG